MAAEKCLWHPIPCCALVPQPHLHTNLQGLLFSPFRPFYRAWCPSSARFCTPLSVQISPLKTSGHRPSEHTLVLSVKLTPDSTRVLWWAHTVVLMLWWVDCSLCLNVQYLAPLFSLVNVLGRLLSIGSFPTFEVSVRDNVARIIDV